MSNVIVHWRATTYGNYTRFNGSNNIHINNCYFYNISGESGSPGECFYGGNVTDVYISNCYSENVRDHFIYIHGDDTPSNNIKITNNLGNPCFFRSVRHTPIIKPIRASYQRPIHPNVNTDATNNTRIIQKIFFGH